MTVASMSADLVQLLVCMSLLTNSAVYLSFSCAPTVLVRWQELVVCSACKGK